MGTERPRMRDVAAAAGVSLKTVSRVVNQEAGVHESTAARVREAIAKMGFQRNELARSLRPGQKSSTIGLVIEDLSNPFYSRIAKGVEDCARERGYLVLSGSSEEDPDRERELITAFAGRRVDGLLVIPAGGDHNYVNELNSTPVVLIDRPAQGLKADLIVLDNAGGAREATQYLLARGHRRIAVIGNARGVYTAAERFRGYREALEKAGVKFDPALAPEGGPPDVDETEAATLEMLAQRRPATAIFALNNRATIGAIRALQSTGQRMDVVGFDDFELADMLSMPLTVVRHDPAQMGRQAAELLFSRIAGNKRPAVRRTLPVELVVRGQREA